MPMVTAMRVYGARDKLAVKGFMCMQMAVGTSGSSTPIIKMASEGKSGQTVLHSRASL